MAIEGASILNDVIGPVMRGPSSSHTAGPFFIGKVVRHLLNAEVAEARVCFDPAGSFAHVYRDQGSDVGFVAGLLGMAITDREFHGSLEVAGRQGVTVRFDITPLAGATHPNTVRIDARAVDGTLLTVLAESIGGGQIRLRAINDTPIDDRCRRPAWLVVAPDAASATHLQAAIGTCAKINPADPSLTSFLCAGSPDEMKRVRNYLAIQSFVASWSIPAVGLISYHTSGIALDDVKNVHRIANERGWTLGNIGMAYEAELLHMTTGDAEQEMIQRWHVMKCAIERGLEGPTDGMRFLAPTSFNVMQVASRGDAICGGLLMEASAAALAVMEQNSAGGVICAAPTAGSAGILPGLLYAAMKQRNFTDEAIARAIFAAGVVGVMISTRATFAAETCACAAETGAAAAMAAAGLIELYGGTVAHALDAATMCLMNTIGLACDPVQGAVEIPCHARNLAGVAHALVSAECVRAGFKAVLPLDETIDAMLRVGERMPSEVRCTSLGGLAATPTAKALVPLQIKRNTSAILQPRD